MSTKADELLGEQRYTGGEVEREERVPRLKRNIAPRRTMEPNRAREFLRDLRVQAAQDLRRRDKQ